MPSPTHRLRSHWATGGILTRMMSGRSLLGLEGSMEERRATTARAGHGRTAICRSSRRARSASSTSIDVRATSARFSPLGTEEPAGGAAAGPRATPPRSRRPAGPAARAGALSRRSLNVRSRLRDSFRARIAGAPSCRALVPSGDDLSVCLNVSRDVSPAQEDLVRSSGRTRRRRGGARRAPGREGESLPMIPGPAQRSSSCA